MTDDTSVEAKERIFRKAPVLSEAQNAWLDRVADMYRSMPHTPQRMIAFRNVFLQANAGRDRLMSWAKERPGSTPRFSDAQIGDIVGNLITQARQIFPGNDLLRVKLREIALQAGVTPRG